MSPPSPDSPAAQPPAPDGGWGWVIVASGFLALLLGYGSPQSMGVLYPEWLLAFGEGKSATAWVGSLVAGVGLIVGEECVVVVLCVENVSEQKHVGAANLPSSPLQLRSAVPVWCVSVLGPSPSSAG